MKFLELIGELLLIYVLYKVIFDFIIPAYTTVKTVKNKMNDIQQHIYEQQQKQATSVKSKPTINKSTTKRSDDYIEFEEVK